MALPKYRQYTEGPFNPPTLAASVFQTIVAHHAAPVSHQDTFLRMRFQFFMSVAIGTVDPPPEIWWSEAAVKLQAYWSPTGSLTAPSLNGHSEHYLGSQMLAPELTMSPSAPGEYYVTWSQECEFITETSRLDPTTSSFPTVSVYLSLWDNNNALDGTYGSVGIFWYWKLFTLWATR